MKKSHKLVLVTLFAFGAFASQACSSDSDPEPSDPGPITPSTGGKNNNSGGNDSGGNGSGGKGSGGKGSGGSDNLGGEGPGPSTGGTFEEPEIEPCPDEADDEQPSSSAVKGAACWNIKGCKGASDEQFLEQCNGTCYPFDNEARIAGYDGTLPPL